MAKSAYTEPHYFSYRDFFNAITGAALVGMMFLFKGSMQRYALSMTSLNIVLVIGLTSIIVSGEIYLLSYKFVKHRETRPFSEFWAKRFFAIMIASFSVTYFISIVYGLYNILTQAEIIKITTAILLPAAVAGAAVEMLKKGYD